MQHHPEIIEGMVGESDGRKIKSEAGRYILLEGGVGATITHAEAIPMGPHSEQHKLRLIIESKRDDQLMCSSDVSDIVRKYIVDLVFRRQS